MHAMLTCFMRQCCQYSGMKETIFNNSSSVHASKIISSATFSMMFVMLSMITGYFLIHPIDLWTIHLTSLLWQAAIFCHNFMRMNSYLHPTSISILKNGNCSLDSQHMWHSSVLRTYSSVFIGVNSTYKWHSWNLIKAGWPELFKY